MDETVTLTFSPSPAITGLLIYTYGDGRTMIPVPVTFDGGERGDSVTVQVRLQAAASDTVSCEFPAYLLEEFGEERVIDAIFDGAAALPAL